MEAQIRYHAVFNNQKTLEYHPDLFAHLPDRFPDICGVNTPESYPSPTNLV